MKEQENQHISSFVSRNFVCPICKVDLESKHMFILHMGSQHPAEYQKMDLEKIDDLEAWKKGDSDVLNL